MILGVSHVAVRTLHMEQDIESLCSQGWMLEFVDHGVAVHPCERGFLSGEHPDVQSLALLRHPAGLPAIELVAPAIPERERGDARLTLPGVDGEGFGGVIRVSDYADTQELFVRQLGFSALGPDGKRLVMRRPLRQWCWDLELEESTDITASSCLDRPGWFVLALLTTDLEQSARMLAAHCASATPPFEIEVNNKRLRIALGVLPSGFGIEMVQIGAKG